ncbi:HAMP domain-containing sensor histidine kinase [Pseudomonas abieticivorans]|uniref:HAMP domain-containing sensor histidine kinase n=1 Tax=Pseudomonas abieticivorans TaxID=2931382 RepID=UPI0020C0EC1D|nr:ATP-binding protein [Pseudomonas sp. PIA16]
MIKPSRLFLKLFLAFWLATTLTFLVGLGLLVLGSFVPADPHLEATLHSEEQLLAQYGLQAGQQLLAVAQPPTGQAIGVYDSAGNVVAGVPIPVPAFEKTVLSKEGDRLSIRSTLDPGIDRDRRPGRAVPLIIGTVMSALFSGYMAFYLAWPLVYLRRAMSDVAQGRFDTRVKPMMGTRRDEIVDLAEDCDRMANQLRLLVDAQQNLLHDISHELRSPLTRMQAAIGLLRQEPAREEMLGRIERESERIDTLIEELLTLARLQGRPDSLESEPLDMIELLAVIAEDAQFEADIKHCHVQLHAQGAFISRVSGELLYRCFENVIRNAVRHTAPHTAVCITTQVDTLGLTVRIADQGPGVEGGRLTRIFQPFERGLDEPGAGFGLGLAIAQRAVEMHGGSIVALNPPTGGLMVKIHLPLRP